MSSYKLLEAVDLLHIATVISSDIHRESFVAKRISTVLLDKLRILDFFASVNKSGLHGPVKWNKNLWGVSHICNRGQLIIGFSRSFRRPLKRAQKYHVGINTLAAYLVTRIRVPLRYVITLHKAHGMISSCVWGFFKHSPTACGDCYKWYCTARTNCICFSFLLSASAECVVGEYDLKLCRYSKYKGVAQNRHWKPSSVSCSRMEVTFWF